MPLIHLLLVFDDRCLALYWIMPFAKVVVIRTSFLYISATCTFWEV